MKQTLSIELKEKTVCLIPEIVYSQVLNYRGKVPRSLTMHLVRPDHWGSLGEKLPTVIWIVGGAWRWTAPMRFAPELSYLAKAGYNVACIDYRTSGEAAFPAQIQDVKTAVRFLRANAEKYGVDENRIAVMGDSAGGYLAAMLGVTEGISEFDTEEWKEYSSSVKAVIDFYGPSELSSQAKTEGIQNVQMTPSRKFLGEDSYWNEDLWKRASPVHYIHKHTPPFLLFHGKEDEIVLPQQSDLLYEALQKQGIPVDLYLLEHTGHAGFEFWQQEIKDIVLQFLEKYL